ncbi:MAG: YdbH domain-containing protein [Pseudomonadota bacterium]
MKLQYDGDLLKKSKVNSGTVENINVRFTSADSAEHSKLELEQIFQTIVSGFDSALNAALPFREFRVNKLNIEINDEAPVTLNDLTVYLESEPKKEIRIGGAELPEIAFKLDESENRIYGDIRDGAHPLFEFTATRALNQLSIQGAINPDNVREHLGHLLPVDFAEFLSESLSFDIDAQLTSNVLTGSGFFSTPSLEIFSASVSDLNLGFRYNLHTNENASGSTTKVSLDQIESTAQLVFGNSINVSRPTISSGSVDINLGYERDRINVQALSFLLPLTAESTKALDVVAENPDFEVKGSLSINENSLDIILEDGSAIQAEKIIPADSVVMGPVRVQPAHDNRLRITDGSISFPDNRWEISPFSARINDTAISIGEIVLKDVTLTAQNAEVATHFSTVSVETDEGAFDFSDLTLGLIHTVREVQLKGDGTLEDLEQRFIYDYTLDYASRRGNGAVHVDSPLPIETLWDHLLTNSLLPSETNYENVSFDSGYLMGSFRINHSPDTQTSLQADIEIREVDVLAKGSRIQGLELRSSLSWRQTGQLSGSAQINVDQLESGVTLNKLQTDLNIRPDRITVDSLSAEAFDGEVLAAPFDVFLQPIEASIPIEIHQLNLQNLVDTQNLDGLRAEGSISGTIPVSFTDGEIRVADGALWNADDGGRIQLTLDADSFGAANNLFTDVVLKALEDFRYDSFTADAAFDPDGQLYVDFKLKGISPNVDPDRAVHLNVNTEQNVFDLLESLRYANSLNDRIDEKVQESYQQSN